MRRAVRERGQASTEYMLLVSVIVIAVVAAAYVFVEPFRGGVTSLAGDASRILATGSVGPVGLDRNGLDSSAGGAPNFNQDDPEEAAPTLGTLGSVEAPAPPQASGSEAPTPP